MRIALIWPKGFDIQFTMPLALGYLKSNLEDSRHEVRIFDCALQNVDSASEELRRFIEEFRPEVVGVSSWTITYPEALRVAVRVKQLNRQVVTILGGIHATVYPAKLLELADVDFGMAGEAEKSFPLFIRQLEAGTADWSGVPGLVFRDQNSQITRNPVQLVEDLDAIRPPDYEAINLRGYIRSGYRYFTRISANAPILATRGCPYACSFCSATVLSGRKIRRHSVPYLVSLVASLRERFGIRLINIIDDNFAFHKDFAKEFCRGVIELKLDGLSLATPNGVRMERMDVELLNLMKQAGWIYVGIAPESGSERTLKLMQKKLDLSIVPEKVAQIRAAGLRVHAFFIIGYPGEEKEDIDQTIRLLRRCRLSFFSLSKFQPLPGTPIYDKLVERGEIKPGFLPGDYTDLYGYTPANLKSVNFNWLVIREHLYLALSDPLNLPYLLDVIGPKRAVRRLWSRLFG